MTIACCEALFYSGYKPLAPQYISPPKTLIKISKPWAFKRQFIVFKLILTKVCILFYFYYTFDDCQNSDLLCRLGVFHFLVKIVVWGQRKINFSEWTNSSTERGKNCFPCSLRDLPVSFEE